MADNNQDNLEILAAAYLADELDSTERADYEAYLARSEAGRRALDDVRAGLEIMDRIPCPQPPSELIERVKQRTRAAEPADPPPILYTIRRAGTLAAAAAILLAVLLWYARPAGTTGGDSALLDRQLEAWIVEDDVLVLRMEQVDYQLGELKRAPETRAMVDHRIENLNDEVDHFWNHHFLGSIEEKEVS